MAVITFMKLSDEQISEIKQRLDDGGMYQHELAAEYHVSQALISNIACGKRRGHVQPAGPGVRGQVTAEGRECSKCETFKPWSEFSPSTSAKTTGHQSACRLCRNEDKRERAAGDTQFTVDHRLAARRWYLKDKYGITLEQYAWLSARQEHKCALCLQPETQRRRQDRTGIVRVVDYLGVDHDHSCGRHVPAKACRWCIRGLLCDDCNRLLGFAERKPAVAVRFSDYLGLRPLLGEGGEARDVVLSVVGL